MRITNAFDMVNVLRERLPVAGMQAHEHTFVMRTFARKLGDDLYALSHEYDVRACVRMMQQCAKYDVLHLYCNSTQIDAEHPSYLDVILLAVANHTSAQVRVFEPTDASVARFTDESLQRGFDLRLACLRCAGLEQGTLFDGVGAACDFEFMHALLLETPVPLLSVTLDGATALLRHRHSQMQDTLAAFAFVGMLDGLHGEHWRSLHGLLRATHRCTEILGTITDFQRARERFTRLGVPGPDLARQSSTIVI